MNMLLPPPLPAPPKTVESLESKSTLFSRVLRIAVIGPTQSGKSSLINKLVDHPFATMTSPVAGTTLQRITSIFSHQDIYQLIFNDTPALSKRMLFHPELLNRDERSFLTIIQRTVLESDHLLLVMAAPWFLAKDCLSYQSERLENLKFLVERVIQWRSCPVTIAFTQVDRLRHYDTHTGIYSGASELEDNLLRHCGAFSNVSKALNTSWLYDIGIESLRTHFYQQSIEASWTYARAVQRASTSPIDDVANVIRAVSFRQPLPCPILHQVTISWRTTPALQDGMLTSHEIVHVLYVPRDRVASLKEGRKPIQVESEYILEQLWPGSPRVDLILIVDGIKVQQIV